MLLMSKDAKVSRRRKIAYLIAPTILVAGFGVAAASQAAHAATLAACDFPSGKTSNLKLTANGISPTGGTIWTKPSGTGCSDLNVHSVSATDNYEGWLQNTSTGKWSHCTEGNNGFVHITAGTHSTTNPPVLCTGVIPGTPMAVVQESNTQRNITLED
jgi:hypothetical protein